MQPDAPDLTWIPRSVRDKLDRAGIKLHLREWQALDWAERQQLCSLACSSALEIADYRRRVDEMVQKTCGRTPDRLPTS